MHTLCAHRSTQLQLTLVPMLRVGMHSVTLRFTNLRRTAHSRLDAERPEMHSHAERGNDNDRIYGQGFSNAVLNASALPNCC
ncbi:hypothetical protein B5U27_04550 [Pseudomonas amygdali pv. lachrymans]|nr:hypothetical protein B5U27_04550 [Pseudomonas amygdali pv. lachrymans]